MDVLTCATLVLACVSEHVQLDVNLGVRVAQTIVDGGVIHLVIESVSHLAVSSALIPAQVHVQRCYNRIQQ